MKLRNMYLPWIGLKQLSITTIYSYNIVYNKTIYKFRQVNFDDDLNWGWKLWDIKDA